MAPLANGSQEGCMHACMHMYNKQVKLMKAFGHVNEDQGPPPSKQVKAKGPSFPQERGASLSLFVFC